MLKLSILAVDDSPTITEMIKDAFEAEGYKTLTAGDGSEALKIALEEYPDIIIADVKMPGMDGWELCSQIRSNPFTSFIPFIFLTEKIEAPDRIKGLQMGADDYLTKPFNMDELLTRVQLILQRMRKTQEAALTRSSQTLAGSTSEMALPDLLQMFGLNQKTGMLRISKVGHLPGRIALRAGKLVSAELGQMRGAKALYRLLEWNDAQFEVAPLMEITPDPDLPGSVEEALMESMRQLDEKKKLEEEFPLSGRILKVVEKPAESEQSPREAELFRVLEEEEEVSSVMNALPWTDYEIYRMLVYFIRKGFVEAA